MQKSLAWRVEETCHNAWPALREVKLGDWVVRFAGGLSRRTNSVNCLGEASGDVDHCIDVCEELYRRAGQPVYFRILPMADPSIDERLAMRGYTVEGETRTLYGNLAAGSHATDPGVILSDDPTALWLPALAAMQGIGDVRLATYAQVLGTLAIPAVFAVVEKDGQPQGVAYAAVHDGIVCLESVFIDERFRRRGLARRMVSTLLAWGQEQGAAGACLQVVADNWPAIDLYRQIGFNRELYLYHYRREPD